MNQAGKNSLERAGFRRLAGIFGLAAVLFGAGGNAWGAESRPARDSLKRELARRHYKLGATYYHTGDYAEAARHFEKAYRVEPAAALLYNIGRCYELLGRLEDAVAAYQRYAKHSTDEHRKARVELLLANLRRRLATKRQREAAAQRQAKPPKPRASVALPAKTQGRLLEIISWTAVIAGSTAFAVGIGFGVDARNKDSDYEKTQATDPNYERLSSIKRDGDRSNALALGAMIGGGVLAAAGVVAVLVQRFRGGSSDRETRDSALAPWLSRGVVGLGGQLTFR